MKLYACNKLRLVMFMGILMLPLAAAAQDTSETFVLKVTLSNPAMRVGDNLILDVATTNPTDHVLYAGQGVHAGLTVELINEQGVDVGLYAMGVPGGKIAEPNAVFASTRRPLSPGSTRHFTFTFKPVPGSLVPGVYKLRVYQREMTSKSTVYSNRVVLTIAQ